MTAPASTVQPVRRRKGSFASDDLPVLSHTRPHKDTINNLARTLPTPAIRKTTLLRYLHTYYRSNIPYLWISLSPRWVSTLSATTPEEQSHNSAHVAAQSLYYPNDQVRQSYSASYLGIYLYRPVTRLASCTITTDAF